MKKNNNDVKLEYEKFSFGTLIMNSGKNCNLRGEIHRCDSRHLELILPMSYEVCVGDVFSMTYGCNKSFIACKRYKNAINFRGEPHIPNPTNIRNNSFLSKKS